MSELEDFEPEVPEEVDREPHELLKERRHARTNRELRSLIRHLEGKNEALSDSLEHVLGMDEVEKPAPVILEKKRGPNHRGVVVQLASDWHYEELIRQETVGGLNQYDLNISRKCIHEFFEIFAWRIDHERASAQIDTAMLWLGGDLIHGHIHEENLEVSQLSPLQASAEVEELVAQGIDFMLDHVDRLLIPCNWGNHGRDTRKKRYTTGAAHSYEYAIYARLKKRYQDDDRVQFFFTESEWTYLTIDEFRFATHHGDFFRYGGGVGGHHIPLMGKLNRMMSNPQQRADFFMFGHHHAYLPAHNYLGNGGMPGYSGFANATAMTYAPRLQANALFDADERIVVGPRPVWFSQ